MTLRVECYAGYRGDEEPRRFEIDGRVVEVVDIIRRGQEPDARYFRVRCNDGCSYTLRHDELDARWTVVAV